MGNPSDDVLYYENFGQEILEWTNVLGVSSSPTTTLLDDPQTNYTRTTYGCEVIAYSAAGVGHTVPVHEAIDLAFFGISGPVSGVPVSGCPGAAHPITTTNVHTTTTKTTKTIKTTKSTTTTTTTTKTTKSTATTATPVIEPQIHFYQCGGLGYT